MCWKADVALIESLAGGGPDAESCWDALSRAVDLRSPRDLESRKRRNAAIALISQSEAHGASAASMRFDLANHAWVVRWFDPTAGKSVSRWYSAAKFGYEEAKQLAVTTRTEVAAALASAEASPSSQHSSNATKEVKVETRASRGRQPPSRQGEWIPCAPPVPHSGGPQDSPSSEVAFDESEGAWVARWLDSQGHPRKQTFSAKRHGYRKARTLSLSAITKEADTDQAEAENRPPKNAELLNATDESPGDRPALQQPPGLRRPQYDIGFLPQDGDDRGLCRTVFRGELCWVAVWLTRSGDLRHHQFAIAEHGEEAAKALAREARLNAGKARRGLWRVQTNTGIPHLSLDSRQNRFRAQRRAKEPLKSFSFGCQNGRYRDPLRAFQAAVRWLLGDEFDVE
eukprot:Polyplicarium_translucidae@DN3174_c0_g1_i1.p1